MITTIFNILDMSLRSIASYSLRLFIVLYAVVLVLFTKNYFTLYFYVLIVLIYAILFIFLKRKLKLPLLRSICDLCFISIVLYKRDISSGISIIYFFIPLMNYPNSSVDAPNFIKTSIYLILWFSVIVMNGLIQINAFSVMLYFCIIIVVLIFKIRNKISNISNKIENETISFYEDIDEEQNQAPHNLIRKLKEIINKSLQIKIKDIYCFQVINSRYQIRYSTNFIINYSINDEKEKKYTRNISRGISLSIDKNDYNNCIGYEITFQRYTFLYLFVLKNEINDFSLLMLDKFSKKSFLFMSKVFSSNIEFNNRMRILQDAYNEKLAFFNEVHNAMHFVKNNLTPIKSFCEVSSILADELRDIDNHELKYIRDERKQLFESIDIVKRYSLNILSGTNNAIKEMQPQIVNYHKIISSLRDNWHKYFNCDPDIKIIGEFNDDMKKRRFYLHEYYLMSLFDNIISNIKKYDAGRNVLSIDFGESGLTINFKNIARSSDFKELVLVASSFNKPTRKEEILKEHHNGLYQMINLSEKLNIYIKMKLNDPERLVIIELSFSEYTEKQDGN